MHRLTASLTVRLGVALAATGLSMGLAAAPASADTPCQQATAAYTAAHAKFVDAKHDLARAKQQLHRAHAHGTAAQFQRAKNKVRRIRVEVFNDKTAMDEALAQQTAVCQG